MKESLWSTCSMMLTVSYQVSNFQYNVTSVNISQWWKQGGRDWSRHWLMLMGYLHCIHYFHMHWKIFCDIVVLITPPPPPPAVTPLIIPVFYLSCLSGIFLIFYFRWQAQVITCILPFTQRIASTPLVPSISLMKWIVKRKNEALWSCHQL